MAVSGPKQCIVLECDALLSSRQNDSPPHIACKPGINYRYYNRKELLSVATPSARNYATIPGMEMRIEIGIFEFIVIQYNLDTVA